MTTVLHVYKQFNCIHKTDDIYKDMQKMLKKI